MKYVQFEIDPEHVDDPLTNKVVASFGEAQEPTDWPRQGVVEDDDPRYLAFVALYLPENPDTPIWRG